MSISKKPWSCINLVMNLLHKQSVVMHSKIVGTCGRRKYCSVYSQCCTPASEVLDQMQTMQCKQPQDSNLLEVCLRWKCDHSVCSLISGILTFNMQLTTH